MDMLKANKELPERITRKNYQAWLNILLPDLIKQWLLKPRLLYLYLIVSVFNGY